MLVKRPQHRAALGLAAIFICHFVLEKIASQELSDKGGG